MWITWGRREGMPRRNVEVRSRSPNVTRPYALFPFASSEEGGQDEGHGKGSGSSNQWRRGRLGATSTGSTVIGSEAPSYSTSLRCRGHDRNENGHTSSTPSGITLRASSSSLYIAARQEVTVCFVTYLHKPNDTKRRTNLTVRAQRPER